MNKIQSFFNSTNKVYGVDVEKYKSIDMITDLADAYVLSTGYGAYIIDYFKQDVIYVSANIAKWCGISAEEVMRNGYEVLFRYISKEDYALLIDINNAAFDFWRGKTAEQCLSYEVSYDFHFGDYMVNQHYKPYQMHDHRIWLALCTVSVSMRKESGNIIMKSYKDDFLYEYSLSSRKWKQKKVVSLTEREKAVIRYSVQGFSSKEIGDILLTSEETVRKQKNMLFRKLGVNSIIEAVHFVLNNGLL